MRSVRSTRPSPDRRRSPTRRLLHLAPLVLAVAVAPLPAELRAQQPAEQQAGAGVVAGVVVTAANQRPLSDVQVSVAGTTLGGLTDAAGHFRITGLTGGTVTLNARRVGFAPASVRATVGSLDVRISLNERASAG